MTSHLMLTLVLVAIAFLTGFAVAWDLAVHRHRERQRLLERRYRELLAQLGDITDDLGSDPVRFGINTGREYVITRYEQLTSELKEETE